MHGKPSLCFLPNEPLANHMNIEADLIHFKEIFKSDLILKANSDLDLINKTHLMIMTLNKSKAKELKQFSHFFVKKFNDSYSSRLNKYVSNL